MMKKLRDLLKFGSGSEQSSDGADPAEELWQQVYGARSSFYEQHIGPFPDDILKMGNMSGVWPGGGLYVIPAERIGSGLWVYSTFGLSNSDMPATTTMVDYSIETDDQGRPSNYTGTLQSKERAPAPPGAAGYGYEMLVIARENTYWPIGFLQWAVGAEITHDAGILERVETYSGLTVEQIQVDQDDWVNVLIAKAQAPLPGGADLPNGRMELIVATTVTEDEMQWSLEHGRDLLLQKLLDSGVGQVSDRNRASVVR